MPRLAIVLTAAALLVSACNSLRFVVAEGPVGKVVEDRKTFWLFGLVTTQNVDVTTFCPNGAVAIGDEQNFVDGLLGVVTIGIYTPRTSTYYCAEDPQT